MLGRHYSMQEIKMEKVIKRCSRCILTEEFPNIQFDSDGICNYCRSWDKKWKNFDYKASEKRLVEIFNWARSQNRRYDCLVPFSGGRDSSYVLYLIKKKYKLKPLVVTFNNLFMSRHAIENISKIITKLDVDHIYFSFSPEQLKKFYRAMILNSGEFCSICAAGINYIKYIYQEKFKIPIVITGTSGRVDEQSPFEVNSTHPLYVRRVLQQSGFSQKAINRLVIPRHYEWGIKEKIKRKLLNYDYIELALPNFIHWKNQEIQQILESELDWETPDPEKDHIDCKFAPMKEYLKNKQIPHFIFKQEKFSQLIRDGQMARQKAISLLQKMIDEEQKRPASYQEFLNFFNLEAEDIERLGTKSHLDFISKDEIAHKESIPFKIASLPWKLFKYISKRAA